MKLGLGTVQFGLDYGVSNQDGKCSRDEVSKILELAAFQGVQYIDTAALYGISEKTLGESLPKNHQFSIVTKTPRFLNSSVSYNDVMILEETFYQSLSKLNQSTIYGLLLHHTDDLFLENGHQLLEKMNDFKKKGLVQKVGVSVYNGEQIDKVLSHHSIDLIQLPINVLDQRLLASGQLSKLKRAGVEIHARSAFLQGLLLMDIHNLPDFFKGIKNHLQDYHRVLNEREITLLHGAISFIQGLSEVDVMVCGVNNRNQLKEIIHCMNNQTLNIDFSRFAIQDEMILNPSNWKIELAER